MGDARKRPVRLEFHPRIRLELHGARLSSDGGLLAYRALDERLGLTAMVESWLVDTRLGLNKRHALIGLLRQSVYARLAGYEDLNDAERLRVDPVFGQLIGGRAAEKGAASVSQMSRFETEMLTARGNLHGLEALNRGWVERAGRFTPKRPVILDSSESPTYGEQEGSAYNGHFAKTCYHPVFCFNHLGDLEGAMLREGNVASAHEWRAVLEPVVDRYRSSDVPVYFRADAAFAMPEVYAYLEGEQVVYAIRIKANAVLERRIDHLLHRRVGRPSKKPEVSYASFEYRAKSWGPPRRVVAKVEWHAGELVPARRFHRHQPQPPRPQRRALLQRSGNGRAVDQGGQVGAEVDAALVLALPRQRGSATALRPGLQPCQLPPPTGATASNQTLVVDDASREAHQDRGPNCPPCPVRHLPDGGGGGAEGVVRADPRTHCPSHAAMRHGIVVDSAPSRHPGPLARAACARCWPKLNVLPRSAKVRIGPNKTAHSEC